MTPKSTASTAISNEIDFEALLANLPVVAHKSTYGIDSEIIYISPGCNVLLEYEEDELIGKHQVPLADIIHPDDHQRLWDHISDSLKEGEEYEVEYRIITKSGKVKWVWEQGKVSSYRGGQPEYIEGFLIDITRRKAMESAFKFSQDRLNLALESAGEGIWEWDLTGKEIFFDQGALKQTGFTEDEFKHGEGFALSLIHPDDRERVMNKANRFIQGKIKKYDIEFRLRRKKGDYIWVWSVGKISARDADGTPLRFVGIHRDINEKKQAEEKIHSQQLELEQIFMAIPDAAIYTDNQRRITKVNKAFSRLFGYSVEEIYRQSARILYADEADYEAYGEQRKQMINTGDQTTFEVRLITKENKVFLAETLGKIVFDQNNKPRGYIGLIRNIEQRKHYEKEILDSQARLKEAESFGKIGNVEWSVQEQRSRWSDEIFRIYELDPEKGVPGYDEIMALHIPDDARRLEDAVIKCLNNSTPYDLDLMIHTHSGERKYLHVIGRPVHDQSGKVTHIKGTVQDITERREMEIELLKAKDRAEESDRLKSVFLANMSHEIRTPLNGILGFIKLLIRPGLKEEQKLQYAEIVTRNGNRLLNTINNLVDISQIESGMKELDMQAIQLNKMLNELTEFFSIEAGRKEIELKTVISLSDSKALIMSDPNILHGIFTNLIKNAVKFTLKGDITIGYNVAGNELTCFVKDTGIGIPSERIEAIFDRFVQADLDDSQVYEGSGLGLSIAKGYTELLGGSIWCNSEEGKGSEFYFTLPYVPAGAGTEALTKLEKEEISPVRDLKVIIAEDDDTSFYLLYEFLSDYCREIYRGRNGLETLSLFREHPDADMIFMDIKMPEMNGIETTREIRKVDKDIPILAQTAYAQVGDRQRMLDAGCSDYITKPIDELELVRLINQLITSS